MSLTPKAIARINAGESGFNPILEVLFTPLEMSLN